MTNQTRPKRVGGAIAVVVGVLIAAVGFGTPAQAHTTDLLGYWNHPPAIYFLKNYSSPLYSNLASYISVGGAAYRIGMRAGSGTGSTDECYSNHGWLPNGEYSNIDGDSISHLNFYYKNWGDPVVMGYVWDLGNKMCHHSDGSAGWQRTELFIHSEGTSGWSDGNYSSAGCVKINQSDRSYLANMYLQAYDTAHAQFWAG